ncbi:hypothetical protein ACTFIU_003671 [Dictyostelium citrinum]
MALNYLLSTTSSEYPIIIHSLLMSLWMFHSRFPHFNSISPKFTLRAKLLRLRFIKFKFSSSDVPCDCPTHVIYTPLFDSNHSGQQVELIKVQKRLSEDEFVEPHHLIKVGQFQNLHSLIIPMDTFQILSNLSEDMGFGRFYSNRADTGDSDNMKSESSKMINSFITKYLIKKVDQGIKENNSNQISKLYFKNKHNKLLK